MAKPVKAKGVGLLAFLWILGYGVLTGFSIHQYREIVSLKGYVQYINANTEKANHLANLIDPVMKLVCEKNKGVYSSDEDQQEEFRKSYESEYHSYILWVRDTCTIGKDVYYIGDNLKWETMAVAPEQKILK